MKETDIKYLAGLLDADGSFFFNYSKNRVYLTISLDLSTGIDKDLKYTNWLCDKLDVKPQVYHREGNASGVDTIKIVVSKRPSVEKLVPRLIKYLVIKGAHLQRLYDKWRELSGTERTDLEILELKEFVRESRAQVGPMRVKSWLPKAYVAGYLDGDGCYLMKKSSGKYEVSSVAHVDDRIVTDLLYKQYGGRVHYQEDWIRWTHALGRTNKSFAVKFLRDMHRHSRLKQHKIEMFLNYHSQRLTEESAKADIIV
jgi:hypothetical protein